MSNDINDSFFVYNNFSYSIETKTARKTAINNLEYSFQSEIRKIEVDTEREKIPLSYALYDQLITLIYRDIKDRDHSNKKQDKDLVSKMKSLCNTIRKETNFKQQNAKEFISSDHMHLILSYQSILYIVSRLLEVVEFIIKEKKTAKKNLFSCIKDKKLELYAKKIKDKNISKVIEEFATVKTINFCLFPANEIKMKININIIIIFIIFLKQLFPNLIELNIDLNIYQLSKEYSSNRNRYDITADEIIKKGNLYKDIFVSNFMILRELFFLGNVMKISFNLYDSYQLELHSVFSQEFFKKNANNHSMQNNPSVVNEIKYSFSIRDKVNSSYYRGNSDLDIDRGCSLSNPFIIISNQVGYEDNNESLENTLVYFLPLLLPDHFNSIKKLQPAFLDYKFIFNSLDPLLFSTVNQLIFKNDNLINLMISLFPEPKATFLRKTYINKYYYDYYDSEYQTQPDLTEDENNIFYDLRKIPFINYQKERPFIKEEKLLVTLFQNFAKNLLELAVILGNKMQNLDSLCIDLSNHSNANYDIENLDQYNCALVCFVCNIFKEIQNKGSQIKLNQLEITLNDYNDGNKYIINQILKKNCFNSNGFSLKDTKIRTLNFSIENINKIIPFENYPCNTLQTLKLSRISYEDLETFTYKLMMNPNMFPSLEIIEIYLDFMNRNSLPLAQKFLKYCIIDSLENVNIEFSQSFSFEDISNIIRTIHSFKSKNNKVKFVLKLHNNEFYSNLKSSNFRTVCLEKLAENLKRDICLSYKADKPYTSMDFELEKLSKKKINDYLSIIYCLEKLGNKKIKTKEVKKKTSNIYNKIFYFVGRLELKTWVKIEII